MNDRTKTIKRTNKALAAATFEGPPPMIFNRKKSIIQVNSLKNFVREDCPDRSGIVPGCGAMRQGERLDG